MVYRGYAAAGWNGMYKRKAVVSVNGVQTSQMKHICTLADASLESCRLGWCTMDSKAVKDAILWSTEAKLTLADASAGGKAVAQKKGI
jgi:hypothetical protein